MTNPTPVQAQGGAAVPALQITGLTKVFGGLRAVGNFDLTVQPGALDGLIGPNGAGKTTVFNMISGLYVPTSGEVDLYGEPLVGLEPFEITQMGIGRTFQNIRLFPNLTVLDNVLIAYHPHAGYGLFDGILRTARFGRKEREMVDRAREFLAIFGLERLQDQTARNLPYGEQRRVEIARALAADPKLLLLDEPAAGMNPNEIEPADGVHPLHSRALQPDHPAHRASDAAGDEHLPEPHGDGLR